MRPSVLLSLALAGGLASAQFITSVLQEQPSTTDLAVLELRAGKDTTSTPDDETTTSTKKTTTAAVKTTTAAAKETTTTSPAKTTATNAKTTSTTHTTSGGAKTTLTSTTTESTPGGAGGVTSDAATGTDRGGAAAASSTDGGGKGSGTGSNGGNGNGNSTQSKGLSAGAAAGIAVGSVVGALAIAGAGFLLWRRRRGGVRGAIVTADYPPHMSDPFSRAGPREPTLPSVSPGPSRPSHPASMGSSMGSSPGPYSTVSSPTAAGSTAYSNGWLGNSAVAYATPRGGAGYRPVGYDEHAESAPSQRHDSYQRLLPADATSPQGQNHDRYERLSLDETGSGLGPGGAPEPQFGGGSQQEDRHSDLPAFMIPGGMSRKASLPGGQPVPTIALQAASPIPGSSRIEVPGRGRGQGRIELPG